MPTISQFWRTFMLKRKIESELARWKKEQKNSESKKALIIRGLRQVGKTYIVEHFAKENYRSFINLNFKANKSLKAAFEGDLDVDTILLNLSAMTNAKAIPGETLIFMDEIQECSSARSSLKSFCLDGRYDVIASGSLLGLNGYNRHLSSGPSVGYESFLDMHGLDFEEFLWAKGVEEDVIKMVKECFEAKRPIPKAIHIFLLRCFKEYLIVGGMPDAVNAFIKDNSFSSSEAVLKSLLSSYRDDFGRYLDKNENERIDVPLKAKLNQIMDSIPSQLAKETKKFTYSSLEGKARKSTHEEAIRWLIDYGLALPCHNLTNLELPLSAYKDPDNFKLYISDTGLLMAMMEKGSANDVLNDNLGIYKGALFEELVASAFHKLGRPLYYYRKPSGLEIDFIMRYEGKVTLVEVKSKGGKTKSATTILNDKTHYDVSSLIKLTSQNIGIVKGTLTLPYYLVFLLGDE